jgi:predicted enzyme related to lactoylglutathione lyase
MKVESVKYMIMAQDMSRAIQFWTKTFGFRVQFEDEHWSELDMHHGILALHGGHHGGLNPTGLSIQVDSLPEAVLAVRDAGGTIVRDPESRPGEPIQLAEAEDTECNRFSLVQYIG